MPAERVTLQVVLFDGKEALHFQEGTNTDSLYGARSSTASKPSWNGLKPSPCTGPGCEMARAVADTNGNNEVYVEN
ncbi:hypothetical protein PtA15_1A802 [Puccinia triticina]|uniref:Uncharacterized protein n=1 Tax=Puccinia triticina TaxID=208348 RepID=A0ABY7CBC4_9BASI|nr:uncharacterized protein PtA15_1A802 [Puccinia triticina]WAQ81461.1 hypothetical protein PtA15_1A802 [Puccinia triticina]WAR52342.1 hypothetical protein PtB15_1B783 [Puccinia triticina]